MHQDTDRIARLEQQLRDERRLRDAAERKAADQAAKARIWRDRAEERSQRIDRLVEERDAHGPVVGAVLRTVRGVRDAARGPDGAPIGPVEPASPAGQASARRRPPALPHVQTATLVIDESLARVTDETTRHDLHDADAGLFEADVVVVEQQAWSQALPALRERIEEWLGLDGRQPLVWVGDDPPTVGHVVACSPGDGVLRPSFDPTRDTPVGRPGAAAADAVGDVGIEDAWAFDPTDEEQLRAAARATAVAGAAEPVRAGDARRRRAWALHTPAAVATHLLGATGWSFEDPTPEVAAVLVSNRPDDLRRQLGAMLAQAHPRLRLQVGCHGFPSSRLRDRLDEVADELAVEVLDLPASRELGWCLNRVVEGVGSPVLAKIDDDDHYGPGYLVDALQAMEYANAAVIGRVCSFTHLEQRDETVLRRIGDEEMYYDGTLVGATMVFTRGVWERGPFPHKTLAEDVGLQRAARTQGERVYVASRWDFVYRRRGATNTWRVPEEHFLSNASHAWDGWHPERADLGVS